MNLSRLDTLSFCQMLTALRLLWHLFRIASSQMTRVRFQKLIFVLEDPEPFQSKKCIHLLLFEAAAEVEVWNQSCLLHHEPAAVACSQKSNSLMDLLFDLQNLALSVFRSPRQCQHQDRSQIIAVNEALQGLRPSLEPDIELRCKCKMIQVPPNLVQ